MGFIPLFEDDTSGTCERTAKKKKLLEKEDKR